MGTVYQAKWRGLQTAVKVVLHTGTMSELEHDLKPLIKVRHPNLCLFMGIACPDDPSFDARKQAITPSNAMGLPSPMGGASPLANGSVSGGHDAAGPAITGSPRFKLTISTGPTAPAVPFHNLAVPGAGPSTSTAASGGGGHVTIPVSPSQSSVAIALSRNAQANLAPAASGSRLLIVSEFANQGSLQKVLADQTAKLPWQQRIGIALGVARALNYLHVSKPTILHKSLSSTNVLLQDFSAKVTDYGLDGLRKYAKSKGAVIDKPMWLAPEVLRRGKYSRASDVYAFGIILWELMTRLIPFRGHDEGKDYVKLIKGITDGLRPPIPSSLPAGLQSLMTSCWAADPAKRPTFAQIIDQLQVLEKVQFDVESLGFITVAVIESKSTDGPNRVRTALVPLGQRQGWMVDWDEVKLERVLGAGSFGEVWLGTFRGKKVAVKKMSSVKREHYMDFVKELNVMCNLRHPNVVLFMGAVVDPQHMSIVMEYCEKGTLFDILHDATQTVDYKRIITLLSSIADALVYLHTNKPPILHRDLKSLNVLLDENYTIKVSDFGLTEFKPTSEDDTKQAPGRGAANKKRGPSDTSTSTSSSSLNAAEEWRDARRKHMGTMLWQAPEVMVDQKYTEAADAYSFGIIMWEMFTRRTPFHDMNPHQAALAVVTDNYRPEIPAFVPPKFRELIEACWHPDPSKRPTFQIIADKLKELEQLGLPRTELNLSNAKLYMKKAAVYAFKSKDVAIVSKPWGTGESKKGDYVVVGPNDDVYTCDATIFAKTYSPVDGPEPFMFRKTQRVLARRQSRDFLMETLEGMEYGVKGDFIAQNPDDGEQWPISKSMFESTYEVADDQVMPPKTPKGTAKPAIVQQSLSQSSGQGQPQVRTRKPGANATSGNVNGAGGGSRLLSLAEDEGA